ncbi:hypothetical protein BLA3211_01807 [Burkholderia aenigmatica]|uniref:Uncharacterized protein n=1 Tax=Burkholderia aenigmatica TaxID=2015348 RepID=A0A6J5ISE9_9BURK|nr:hypothetical protein BLA3211_01807 [Burkholderia aenigmatica]
MDGPSDLACGRHVLVDMSDTNPEVLNDLSSLERALTEAERRACCRFGR